jgi:uncharacterized protein (DUF305 family)
VRLPSAGTARHIAIALVAAVLVASGYAVGVWRGSPRYPAETSVDVGFARDMSVHHAQAVTLSQLANVRATLPAVRELAHDIVLSQQREIGVMAGWLQQWGVPESTQTPPMSWMTHQFVPEPDSDPPMPGMATRHEEAAFAVTRGLDVDRQFCKLMLRHHVGGLHMISEAIGRASRPETRALAQQMQTDQRREIVLLQQLLDHVDSNVPSS